ncbi:beta-aspartyl-peptidase [Jejubacter calystegiae]|uniref:Isoaspartyl dipeptidase n=1 Tax=Jejubacter calystegiae TaxID=2579935 RepID=A0A4P8YHM4_9ENTR|nr:beta-aspartyl-peptidase [Jejubacter calystegiae]QCT20189.1 beta-aspartyl-peptidase [Jejubacter calystegiae]
MTNSLDFTLIQNARLLTPEGSRQSSLLMGAGKILAIAPDLLPPRQLQCRMVDARGHWVVPGIIDQHVHLTGGGGEAGFHTRTPEVMLSQLLKAGITGVMGLLGTDGMTRHVASLFAKTMGLRNEGISAWMLTGSYEVPTITITGSVRDDIAFIEPVLGVKTAISDHRASQPTIEELIRIATQARSAALLTQKPGLVVMHMGNASSALAPLEEVLARSDVPAGHFLPTHVNRQRHLLEYGIRLARTQGVNLDITSGISPVSGARGAVKPSDAVLEAQEQGVSLSQLTLSSDGNGSIPAFDKQGNVCGLTVAGFSSLLDEARDLSQRLTLEQAWPLLSSNVAHRLKLSHKGHIALGYDADLLMLDDAFDVERLWAGGRLMVDNGQPCVRGTFE